MPVVNKVFRLALAAATPAIKLAVDSKPSLAPSTPARNQAPRVAKCRSPWLCELGMYPTLAIGCDTIVVTDTTLPRWDVSDLYPSLTSREFAAAQESIAAEIDRLVALYNEVQVGADNHSPARVNDVLSDTNRVHKAYGTISAVVMATVATDSTDEVGQRAQSQLRTQGAKLGQLGARLAAWTGTVGAEAMTSQGGAAAEHDWPLRRLEVRATRQMDPVAEDLYAQVSTTGSQAWAQLYNDVTSQLVVDCAGTSLPMPSLRALASHADPDQRRTAYEAELAAWPTAATTLAAAMNAIKGEADIINRRRGWPSALDASLYANSVDRRTFDAMQAAINDSLPDFRRWLRIKAGLHGYDGGLKFHDLFAPLPITENSVAWNEGTARVERAFAGYSPDLAALVRRAVDDRWIDVGPRPGKRGGAFCASVHDDRSLVLLNWSGSAEGVSTLAHELGHAYHNTRLAHRTPMQRQLPMALAETASIFCETLLVESGLQAATGAERLALLDGDLQGSTQVIVDIQSRLIFEGEVFARRPRASLTANDLCGLMADAQEQAYGDGLHPTIRHPYMWAAKPHYYSSHFYNWPYAFGLLFGLGLYARYLDDPDRFLAGYDDLLSNVALAPAEALGQSFGLDLTGEAFWQSSLDSIRRRISDYEELTHTLL